jgi:hypothetical protein
MFPSGSILISSVSRPKHATPRQTPSGFEGEILLFAPSSTPEISGTCSQTVAPAHDSFVVTRSRHNISGITFQSPITPSSVLGLLFVFEQQGACTGRSQSTWLRSLENARTTQA